MTHRSIYFYGNKISDYGIQNKRLDYRTLAKSFEAVLVNDITKLFYSSVNGEYIEPEQVNGIIDNSDEIEEIQEQIELLENSISEAGNLPEDEKIQNQIDTLQEQIDALEEEQEESYSPDILQYYIISDSGADIIKRYTNDPLYYIDFLDVYVWGVTHWGTSWDYVLTDCVLEIEEDEQ